MKLMTSVVLVALFLIMAVIPFTKTEQYEKMNRPGVDVQVCDESLQIFANAWRVEIARRFPDAVAVLCHGGEWVDGEWLVKAPEYDMPLMTADHLAQHFKDKFPGRTIVLLCCNPGHLHLHVHGVYHATDSVWCIPDRAIATDPERERLTLDGYPALGDDRWASDPGVSGNIWEFVED